MTVQAEYERKLSAAFGEMEAAGMRKPRYMPLTFRWLRRLGLKVRPPFYMAAWLYFAGHAVWFGAFMGGYLWLTQWAGWRTSEDNFESAALTGLFYGTFMALARSYTRRKHRLSRWEDL